MRVIVICRFSGSRTVSPDAERRAQRWVAISFFLLAPYAAAEAIETLIDRAAAETSWLGIALTAGTLVICPWLGLAKPRIAEKLGSRATYGEGTQNLLCAILARAVLVGLAANTLFGLWWLDPTIALLIAAICVRESQGSARRAVRLRVGYDDVSRQAPFRYSESYVPKRRRQSDDDLDMGAGRAMRERR